MEDEFMTESEFKDKVVANLKTTKDYVRHVLEKSVKARNDNHWLIFKVWEAKGYNICMEKVGDDNEIVFRMPFSELSKMTMQETITRVCREVQNKDGEFLPTDPQVIYKRKLKEEAIKKYYGETSSTYEQWKLIAYDIG